jgi:ubiquinone/menaquinone biosynthesis C-methylase UbiE
MEAYLYEDMYVLEDTHWWHCSKRQLVIEALQKWIASTPSIRSNKKLKLLDVGCGTGKNAETFAQFGEVYGVDFSSDALKFCKKRGLTNVKKADVEKKIPYPTNTFDVITLLDVLEHIEEAPSLKEIYRVLKPGGYLLVTVPAFKWLWSNWDVVLHHKRRYTVAMLEDSLQQQGFHIKFSSYVYMFLVAPMYLVRLVKSLFSTGNEYQSDFQLSSPLINTMFTLAANIDRKLMWLLRLPFGTSVFAAAQKVRNG